MTALLQNLKQGNLAFQLLGSVLEKQQKRRTESRGRGVQHYNCNSAVAEALDAERLALNEIEKAVKVGSESESDAPLLQRAKHKARISIDL